MKNMKKVGKRTLSLFLALVMCLGMVNVTVFADEAETTPETAPETIEEHYTCDNKEEHEHTDKCYVDPEECVHEFDDDGICIKCGAEKPECEHEYGEDSICTKCGAEKPETEGKSKDEPPAPVCEHEFDNGI